MRLQAARRNPRVSRAPPTEGRSSVHARSRRTTSGFSGALGYLVSWGPSQTSGPSPKSSEPWRSICPLTDLPPRAALSLLQGHDMPCPYREAQRGTRPPAHTPNCQRTGVRLPPAPTPPGRSRSPPRNRTSAPRAPGGSPRSRKAPMLRPFLPRGRWPARRDAPSRPSGRPRRGLSPPQTPTRRPPIAGYASPVRRRATHNVRI